MSGIVSLRMPALVFGRLIVTAVPRLPRRFPSPARTLPSRSTATIDRASTSPARRPQNSASIALGKIALPRSLSTTSPIWSAVRDLHLFRRDLRRTLAVSPANVPRKQAVANRIAKRFPQQRREHAVPSAGQDRWCASSRATPQRRPCRAAARPCSPMCGAICFASRTPITLARCVADVPRRVPLVDAGGYMA